MIAQPIFDISSLAETAFHQRLYPHLAGRTESQEALNRAVAYDHLAVLVSFQRRDDLMQLQMFFGPKIYAHGPAA